MSHVNAIVLWADKESMKNIVRRLILIGLLFSLMGCANPKMLFYKPGLTTEEFNRDRYDCVQQSRILWSGGGTGGIGLAMIISAKSTADKQAAEMFIMCMEARGYTAREVSDEEFEKQKNSVPTDKKTIVSPAFQQKYVDMAKVMRDSQYGKRAKELLRVFAEEQEVKKSDMEEEKSSAGEDKVVTQNTGAPHMEQRYDSQDRVSSVRKYLTEFVYRHAGRVAQDIANRKNYGLSYVQPGDLDDISDDVITELDKLPVANVEIYFQSIAR